MSRGRQAYPLVRVVQRQNNPNIFKKFQQRHWFFYLGLGMIAILMLWFLGSAILAWGIQRAYDLRYGMPRTYQVDQAVGQGGDSQEHPSHFIAINLHQQAVIIELRSGNPAKSITYVIPISNDNGEAPVTLEFRDLTSDGKLDMIIHIHLPSQDQMVVFINAGDQFRPANKDDHIQIPT